MATLRYFAAAREAAATSVETIDAATVGAVLAEAGVRHGAHFVAVLGQCRVWVNGQPAQLDAAVTEADEIAVLLPVSGGSGGNGPVLPTVSGGSGGSGPVLPPRRPSAPPAPARA